MEANYRSFAKWEYRGFTIKLPQCNQNVAFVTGLSAFFIAYLLHFE